MSSKKDETVVEETEIELVPTERPLKAIIGAVATVIAVAAFVMVSKRKRLIAVEIETVTTEPVATEPVTTKNTKNTKNAKTDEDTTSA